MLKKILTGLIFVLLLIQFVPSDRSNPAVKANLEAGDEITTLLRRACYDCHSNETEWPWYGYVAPVSWWLVDHVQDARKELNFSEWENYSTKRKDRKLEEIIEEVEEENMPLPNYLILHGDAAISDTDFSILKEWVELERKKTRSTEEQE